MLTQTPLTLCPLPSICFIEATGPDTETFLIAQLSRNVEGDPLSRSPLAAWHDSKGRVLALLRALQSNGKWLLMTHGTHPGVLILQLSVFILRDDVQLQDASAKWSGAIALGEIDRWLKDHNSTLGPNPGDATVTNGMFVIRINSATAYLAVPEDAFPTIESQFSMAGREEGELAEIRLGLSNLPPNLAKHFSSQMLNLDQLGALSLDKGCYPGQEVIARIQNLGSVKRRLFRFSGLLREKPSIGSGLIDPAGIKVGEILCAARANDQRVEFLAVVKTDTVHEHLVCSEEPSAQITKETLPTEVSLAATKPQA